MRSKNKWGYLSRYGTSFDGNRLYKKHKVKNPIIDKYYFMTMGEIKSNLVWRGNIPSDNPKKWRYTFHPKDKFSKPHPNKFHFYKKRDKEYYLQEDPFRRTKLMGKEFMKGIGSIIWGNLLFLLKYLL